MVIRYAVGVMLAGMLAATSSCAKERSEPLEVQPAEMLPVCVESELSGVAPKREELTAHREFELPAIGYPEGEEPDEWGLPLTLQVDETGRVTCYLSKDIFDRNRDLNQRRRAVLEAVSGWRYRPFLVDGKPMAAIVYESVYEEITRTNPETFPDVSIEQITISLERSGCFGSCPSYMAEIHGDGAVVYVGKAYVDILGRHAFKIPREAVAELVEIARRDGIWGLAGSYRAQITDNPTYRLKLKAGNEIREITDYVGERAGMPKAITAFEEAVDRIGRTNEWTSLSMVSVEALQNEGFDFKSKEAGELLVRSIANDDGNDERAMLKLVELGAPLSAVNISGPMSMMSGDTTAIDQVLLNHRESLLGPLLQHGVLETKGRPSQAKIDAAFRNAIRGGRLSMVETVWGQPATRPHPALSFEDVEEARGGETKVAKQSPVTLLLSKKYRDDGWQGLEIAQWLAAKGCDLAAHAANGDTLLHIAVGAGDIEFVRYLLAQGLDASAPGEFGLPALGSATDEEVALLLLQAGSSWHMDDQGKGFLRYARDQYWGRVLAWIAAHP